VVYVDGTVDFFEYRNDDTWLILSIEDFLRPLGCAIVERVQVYWCFPRKDFSDGSFQMR
jgi:hypothetical protein